MFKPCPHNYSATVFAGSGLQLEDLTARLLYDMKNHLQIQTLLLLPRLTLQGRQILSGLGFRDTSERTGWPRVQGPPCVQHRDVSTASLAAAPST